MTPRPIDRMTPEPPSPSTCCNCPRQCLADRPSAGGWCMSDDRIHVASLVIHKGEEPPVSGEKGIVNLFFPSCNMHCIYCQNWEISERGHEGTVMSLEEVCDSISELLPLSEGNLGFVSPAHFTAQVRSIVEELHRRGLYPTVVYNTNGFELPATVRLLENTVDVWLPDFKYSDDGLAESLSSAPGYSGHALASLREMLRQTGVTLQTDERGIARRGIIIRHLVLPGFVENSKGVLRLIAEEVSPNVHISLMSQYYPTSKILELECGHTSNDGKENSMAVPGSLLRPVTREEYEAVVDEFHSLGFRKGWLQDHGSHRSYRPDFSRDEPFMED